MKKIIFLLMFFLCITSILHAEPKRENGLSVHFAPKSASEALGANKNGFMVSQTKSLKETSERPVFDTPEKLIEYFLSQPQEIRENGLWVITTNPKAYSADEMKSTEVLKDLCRQKNIPLFFCRGMLLPNGWVAADKFNLAESDNLVEAREVEAKAVAADSRKDYDEAIKLYTQALGTTSSPAYVLHDRGMAYNHKGEFDKAIADLNKAMEMDPNEKDFIAQCYNDRGNAYYDSEQYEKSWQDVQKAIELGYKVHPGFIAALKSKGYSSASLGSTIVEKNNAVDASSLSSLKLSATTASGKPDKRIAVIDNAIYHIGDSVAGYKIDEIKDGCVVLMDDKGDKHEIRI